MKFNDLIDKLSKIPKSQRVAIYVAIYVLVALIYVFGFYFSTQDAISAIEKEKSENVSKLDLRRQQVGSLQSLKEEAIRLEVKLERAQKELPQSSEMPLLIKNISETGRKVGLEISKFEPQQESPSDSNEFVSRLPIKLKVEGGFHQVAMFFDKISKMDRIVHVKDIDIEIVEEENSNIILEVSGKAITFRFLSDEEREANLKKKKKGKKGKRGKRAKKAKKGKGK